MPLEDLKILGWAGTGIVLSTARSLFYKENLRDYTHLRDIYDIVNRWELFKEFSDKWYRKIHDLTIEGCAMSSLVSGGFEYNNLRGKTGHAS